MTFKKRGQGALEYLLLIGGAVLIAVIVIALLVGMGGQNTDTIQDQTAKAQQITDTPVPATIVSLTPIDCNSNPVNGISYAVFDLTWVELGTGVQDFSMQDFYGVDLNIDINSTTRYTDALGAIAFPVATVDEPNDFVALSGRDKPARIIIQLPGDSVCADTYRGQITTSKNGQEARSVVKTINFDEGEN